jgi:NAD(P)-dependent dehydrogenase (short-subunit alcohol dehydrogenase family)
MFNLAQKASLVTGAGSGIGGAIAWVFAADPRDGNPLPRAGWFVGKR